jgi:hypothetical protein
MDSDTKEDGQGKDSARENEEPAPGSGSEGLETDIDGMPVRHATTGSHPALIALAVVLVIILALTVAAYGTLVTEIGLPPVSGAAYPYTTSYSAVIPPGQPVSIAGVPLRVVDAGETLQVILDYRPEQFIPGEPNTIARGTAETRSLGQVISHTGYQVDAVYKGTVGDSADLTLVILTTTQPSSHLVKALLPTGVEISPV